MINVNAFKPGITFLLDGNVLMVMDAHHSKQGRGQPSVKAKVKDLRTGAITVKTFTGGERVAKAHIDKKAMSFLYNDGSNLILMDKSSYEQIEIPITKVEWELNFLKEGNNVEVRMFEDEILDLELPVNIELEVTEAPDAVKGNTQSNPLKKIKLETNYELEAPMFIGVGEKIIVSSETGKYVGRGK